MADLEASAERSVAKGNGEELSLQVLEQELSSVQEADRKANKRKCRALEQRVSMLMDSVQKRQEADSAFAASHEKEIRRVATICQKALECVRKYGKVNPVQKNLTQIQIKKLFKAHNKEVVKIATDLEMYKYGFSMDDYYIAQPSKYPPRKWLDVIDNIVIRPPRFNYNDRTHLLPEQFKWEGGEFTRREVKIFNSRGLKLRCSHYEPIAGQRPSEAMPCVVYCHGNGGSQCDVWSGGAEVVEVMAAMDVTVFGFDFSGCGKSEGGYISLGHYERDDIDAVVDYLSSQPSVSRIALWGRSMGAASSMMYVSENPNKIAAVVMDSSFESLERVVYDFAWMKLKIPKPLVMAAYPFFRASIKDRAHFDVNTLSPKTAASKLDSVPVVFGHGEEDDFVVKGNSETLFAKYQGKKDLILFQGGHNDKRPLFFYQRCALFLVSSLLEQNPDKYFNMVAEKSDQDIKLAALREGEKRKEARRERYMKHHEEMEKEELKSKGKKGAKSKAPESRGAKGKEIEPDSQMERPPGQSKLESMDVAVGDLADTRRESINLEADHFATDSFGGHIDTRLDIRSHSISNRVPKNSAGEQQI